MKRLITISTLMLLALPTLALACHVTDMTGTADCNGWNLCATVYFAGSVYSGTLNYQVVITDDQGNEVNHIQASETVGRGSETCAGEYTYCFDGIWDGDYQSSSFHVYLCGNLNGGTPQSFDFDLSCTVDDDATSFSGVKALYR